MYECRWWWWCWIEIEIAIAIGFRNRNYFVGVINVWERKAGKKRRLEPTNDRTNERMNKYWNVVFAANERNSELCIYYLAMRVPFPYCSFVRIDFAHHLHISIISFHCSRSVSFRFLSFCNQHWENLIFNHSIFSGCIRVDLPISNWDSCWWNIYTHSYIVEIFAWHQTRKDG